MTLHKMKLTVAAAAALALVSGSVHADASVDGTAYEQEVKQANAAADQIKQGERQQWLESGLQIVRVGEDCSAPKNRLSFATDANGKLMTCGGPHDKWADAAPIVRMIDQASFSCGAGIPGLC
jgi:hypothetical protein